MNPFVPQTAELGAFEARKGFLVSLQVPVGPKVGQSHVPLSSALGIMAAAVSPARLRVVAQDSCILTSLI